MKVDTKLKPGALDAKVEHFFEIAGRKIANLDRSWNSAKGSPVITVKGKYTSRAWTEWTQGFQFGCQLLQYDATGDRQFLDKALTKIDEFMPAHLTHTGVHDHGFNTVSTYGNLRRLILEGKAGHVKPALASSELAIKLSGAVQAARWSRIKDGTGYIYSFNGPHSLFSDTIRSCRVLVLADKLGHNLMGEGDEKISLLKRAAEHILNTARYNVYYGEGRDSYDVPGRVVHESIFNMNDGAYRCPSTQQGYSPFSTWTRGLAWIILGAAEQLEYFDTLSKSELRSLGKLKNLKEILLMMAMAASDFYIANTSLDGIPYWDTGAPGLAKMPRYRNEKAKPENPYEPVDSSAAAIAAQGLLRLGNYLGARSKKGKLYQQAGLCVARTLMSPPFLSKDPRHQGLLLHSVYHQPNGWDHIPKGKKVPCGESSMWGDYHAMELAVYLQRLIKGGAYLTFFTP